MVLVRAAALFLAGEARLTGVQLGLAESLTFGALISARPQHNTIRAPLFAAPHSLIPQGQYRLTLSLR